MDTKHQEVQCVRGMKPVQHRFLIRGTRYSAIPVMSITGIHDV